MKRDNLGKHFCVQKAAVIAFPLTCSTIGCETPVEEIVFHTRTSSSKLALSLYPTLSEGALKSSV